MPLGTLAIQWYRTVLLFGPNKLKERPPIKKLKVYGIILCCILSVLTSVSLVVIADYTYNYVWSGAYGIFYQAIWISIAIIPLSFIPLILRSKYFYIPIICICIPFAIDSLMPPVYGEQYKKHFGIYMKDLIHKADSLYNKQNYIEALWAYSKACRSGNDKACQKAEYIEKSPEYANAIKQKADDFFTQKNYSQAILNYYRACDMNVDEACKMAIESDKVAAMRGDHDAQSRLAGLYSRGTTIFCTRLLVPIDLKEADKWYKMMKK